MNTTTTKTDLVEPKAVVEATSPGCEAAQERMIAEALRQQPIERTVTILADDYDGLKTICKHYREKCAEVTAQRDEMREGWNDMARRFDQMKAQRDELLKAAILAQAVIGGSDTSGSGQRQAHAALFAAISKSEQH